mgnify:CR=1 FL=1
MGVDKSLMEMKEVLANLPPRLVLDSYWEVLSMLSREFTLIFKHKRSFTKSQLKKVIYDRIKRFDNPFIRRIYQRSLNVVDDIVSVLLETGLLSSENNTLLRSDILDDVYYLLKKKVKKSVTRLVAWTVWYLYHNGVKTFSTRELLRYISYDNLECIKELPYLHVWKENKFHKLLERSESKGIWLFKETPHSFARPVLLESLHKRLLFALSKIYKLKREIDEKELLDTLRSLELKSLERSLSKLKLKSENGKWHIDESDIKRIEDILFDDLPNHTQWPLFGIIATFDPRFKIEGELHNVYVDMPNAFIEQFLHKLSSLSSKYANDLETLYKEAIKLRDEFNEEFTKQFGNWYKILLRKERFGKRRLGVKAKINWTLFQQFLNDLAEEDIPLENKYRYLSLCRSGITWMKEEPRKELCEERVREIAKKDINVIVAEINDLINRLRQARRRHRNRLLIRRKIQPLLLAYFPEMILTLQVIRNCVSKGAISTCYREMRKILESLSWVVVDDILLFRRNDNGYPGRFFVPPLRMPSKEWYEWSRNKNLIIKSLSDLTKSLESIVKKIRDKYGWTKRKIERAIFDNMTYPLFLVSIGVSRQIPANLKLAIPSYEVKPFKPVIAKNIENVIFQLKSDRLSNSDREFVKELTELLIEGKSPTITIPYPSTSFVIQLMEKLSKLNLMRLYDEYSYFVHSYDEAWQLYPFSSVLEFKIFKHEIRLFIEVISKLLTFYENNIIKR